MTTHDDTDKEESKCPYCGHTVVTFWTPHGMLPDPTITLVADWVYHTRCWDKQVEEHPP